MPTTLATRAMEQSSYVITASFTDEDGAAVTPSTATWTLTDEAGTVINNREDENIAALDTSVDILLSGDDLALSGERSEGRIFTIEGTYNSSLGAGLPLVAHCRFVVVGMIPV